MSSPRIAKASLGLRQRPHKTTGRWQTSWPTTAATCRCNGRVATQEAEELRAKTKAYVARAWADTPAIRRNVKGEIAITFLLLEPDRKGSTTRLEHERKDNWTQKSKRNHGYNVAQKGVCQPEPTQYSRGRAGRSDGHGRNKFGERPVDIRQRKS